MATANVSTSPVATTPIFADKTNVYRYLADIPLEDLLDALIVEASKLPAMEGPVVHKTRRGTRVLNTQDYYERQNMIIMFHDLIENYPAPLVPVFFKEFAQAPEDTDIVLFHLRFMKKHDAHFRATAEEKRRRVAVPAPASRLPRLESQVSRRFPFRPAVTQSRPASAEAKLHAYWYDDCYKKMLHASWTNLNVVATLLNTERYPDYKAFTIPMREMGGGWARASRAWYKAQCVLLPQSRVRPYEPHAVAYLVKRSSGTFSLVEETPDLHVAMTRFLLTPTAERTAARRPPLEVARAMFGMLTGDTAQLFTPELKDEFLSAMADASRDDVLHKIVDVLTFSHPLIANPQIHRQRLRDRRFSGKALTKLTPSDMLPEFYENQQTRGAEDALKAITRKRAEWKNTFLQLETQVEGGGSRVATRPSLARNLKRPRLDVVGCPSTIQDPVYYSSSSEGGHMVCADADDVLLHPEMYPTRVVTLVRAMNRTWAEMFEDEETEERCSFCGKTLPTDYFSSVEEGGKIVRFCHRVCFKNYSFERKKEEEKE